MRTLLLVFSAVMLALGGLIAPLNAQEPLEKTGELPPLYRAEMGLAEGFVSDMMASGVVVPVPVDPGGGYTHEQHKRNYRAIYLAGQLYRIT